MTVGYKIEVEVYGWRAGREGVNLEKSAGREGEGKFKTPTRTTRVWGTHERATRLWASDLD
jgi:hypothetical protein